LRALKKSDDCPDLNPRQLEGGSENPGLPGYFH
jgi:hypothetical protein